MNYITLKTMIQEPFFKSLSALELRTLYVLDAHANAKGRCWPSTRTLAKYVFGEDKAPTRLFPVLRRLEDKGVIRIERRTGRVNRYQLCCVGTSEETVRTRSDRGVRTNCSEGSEQSVRTGSEQSVRSKTPKKKKRKTPSSGSAPASRRVREDDEITKAFQALPPEGVRSKRLIREGLDEYGPDVLELILADSMGKDNPTAFALWALKDMERYLAKRRQLYRTNGEATTEGNGTLVTRIEHTTPTRLRLNEPGDVDDDDEDDYDAGDCERDGCNGWYRLRHVTKHYRLLCCSICGHEVKRVRNQEVVSTRPFRVMIT